MENFFGEVRGRDHDEVALAHAEEEDVAEAFGEVGEVAVVEVIADLEPVSEDWDGERAGRELEAAAAEGGDDNGDDGGEKESKEGLLQEEEIHCDEVEWWVRMVVKLMLTMTIMMMRGPGEVVGKLLLVEGVETLGK